MMVIPKTLATATQGILQNNHLLEAALGADIRLYHKKYCPQAIVAWGQKPSSQKAKKLAKKLNLPILTAEDGFLRSLDSGIRSKFGASFVLDDLGIYFDLTTPNRLQTLIMDTISTWNDQKRQKSEHCIQMIVDNHLSKYNITTDTPNLSRLAGNNNAHIIIIDQVAGDASIAGAGASCGDFVAMIKHAQQTYPDSNLWIKTHPAGMGCLSHLKTSESVQLLDELCNPLLLLKQAKAVYTVSSHMGFEALLLGKTVHCFGVSWYAGFGLTVDDYLTNKPLYQQVKMHHQRLGLTTLPDVVQLFYASYITYSHYANPATKKACKIEEVMDYLILNRTWQERLSGDILVYGISRWKVGFVEKFLSFPKTHLGIIAKKLRLLWNNTLYQIRTTHQDNKYLPPLVKKTHQQYLVWGLKSKEQLLDKLIKFGAIQPVVWCMEDGFIRSNGLGAGLLEPLSVVVDDLGIYYDANTTSRLEQILTNICLNAKERQRAKNLQTLLLTRRVSKYNVGTKNHDFFDKIHHLKEKMPNTIVRLVVGQVEDDASVQNCASSVRTNRELLSQVRESHPDDIVIYKPHPDIEAGLRVGKVDDKTLQKADLVAHHIAMPDCLDICQVVHTISSLTGFEALIRGRDVVCYGMPFYAGFGLTTDVVEPTNTPKQHAMSRRRRSTPLDIESLIFGTLIMYPLYRLPYGYGVTTPEKVIEYLYHHTSHTTIQKGRLQQLLKLNAMRSYKSIFKPR